MAGSSVAVTCRAGSRGRREKLYGVLRLYELGELNQYVLQAELRLGKRPRRPSHRLELIALGIQALDRIGERFGIIRGDCKSAAILSHQVAHPARVVDEHRLTDG